MQLKMVHRRFVVIALLATASCGGQADGARQSVTGSTGQTKATGWIVYQYQARGDSRFSLFRARPDGSKREEVAPKLAEVLFSAPSPDRRSIALWGDNHIWVVENGGSTLRLVAEETRAHYSIGPVVWASDGESIAYLENEWAQRDAQSMPRTIKNRVLAVPASGGQARVIVPAFREPEWAQLGGYDAGRLLRFTTFSLTAGEPALIDTPDGSIERQFDGVTMSGHDSFAVTRDLSKVYYTPADEPNVMVERTLAGGVTTVLYEATISASLGKPILSADKASLVFTVHEPGEAFVVRRSLRDGNVQKFLEDAGHMNASVDGISPNGRSAWISTDCTCGAGGAYYPTGDYKILDLETGQVSKFYRAAPGDRNALVAEDLGFSAWLVD